MTRGNAVQVAKAFVAGLVAVLLLVPEPVWGKVRPDWSRVRAVPEGAKAQILLYEDAAPPGARKVRGILHAVSEGSVTILQPSGESRTLEKRDVWKVRVRRPLFGWIKRLAVSAGAGFAAGSLFDDPRLSTTLVGYFLFISGPLLATSSRFKEIYNVPPEQRDLQRARRLGVS